MRIDPEAVYLLYSPIDDDHAPFATYRDLAYKALGALELDLPANGSILLKPNATVLYPPDKRVITHPGFLAGLLDTLLEGGVEAQRLVVGDGQSGEHSKHGHTWALAGYSGALDGRGVRLAELNRFPSRRVDVPDGVVYDQYPIYEEVADCAFFFNVPLAKCHNLGCTTLSIKNLMGILGRPERHLCSVQEIDKPHDADLWRLTDSGLSLFEDRFYHKLCDLVAALRQLDMPRLNIVDGLIGRDGTAFNEGQNYPLGWTVAGQNEVHVDSVATYLMGLDPQATPYLQFAQKRGLGTNRIDKIEIVDLGTQQPLAGPALQAIRRAEPLMPVSRCKDGYYKRFNADGSAAPWRIDEINAQRAADGLAPIAVEQASDHVRA